MHRVCQRRAPGWVAVAGGGSKMAAVPFPFPGARVTESLFAPRLLIVTGKGGTGKSTVAAALALAGSRTGRTTCLVEVEGRQTMSRLFSTAPWDFAEREFRPGLHGLSIDPEASLVEYLDLFYGARRISKLVVGSTAVEFATAAAPGIKDVLLIGKVKEMERRRRPDGRFAYDLIVLDAPPTGRIVNFLKAPEATTEIVNVGPIRQQAQTVIDMLTDAERTHVHLVSLYEELPVTETVESAAALRQLGVTLGPAIVNRVLAEHLDEAAAKALADEMGPDDLARILSRAGLEVDALQAEALRDVGLGHLARCELQERMREELAARLDLGVIELPSVSSDAFGEREVAVLAEALGEAR